MYICGTPKWREEKTRILKRTLGLQPEKILIFESSFFLFAERETRFSEKVRLVVPGDTLFREGAFCGAR